MRLLFGMVLAAALAHAAKTLDVYFVDVEGGQATLVVTPSKQSLLVDSGWPGFNGRDAGRIQAAAKAAGRRAGDYCRYAREVHGCAARGLSRRDPGSGLKPASEVRHGNCRGDGQTAKIRAEAIPGNGDEIQTPYIHGRRLSPNGRGRHPQ